ncbi:hypothetical protein HDU96_006476, partial [Phlyctochytrium bullatum]
MPLNPLDLLQDGTVKHPVDPAKYAQERAAQHEKHEPLFKVTRHAPTDVATTDGTPVANAKKSEQRL